MFLHQFFVRGLGHASYLVGDADAGLAAVVDPRRDVDAYLDIARAEGLRITEILETHVHNDYVSGAEELRPAWATGPAVRPLPPHQLAMPPEHGRRGDEEGDPAVARDHPTRRREEDSGRWAGAWVGTTSRRG